MAGAVTKGLGMTEVESAQVRAAKEKISTVLNGGRKHAYFDSCHPEHRQAVETMQRLHEIVYPTVPQK
jgi:hypothetical protein